MNNADFRAFLIAPSAAASSDDAPAPLVPQKSGEELFAEPAAEPILWDADGSRLAISASHVDATCDLVALNPHADLWAESDDHRDVNRARSLGVMRTSHGFRRPLRGDVAPLSLAKRVLDTLGPSNLSRNGQISECVRAAKASRLAANTWDLGKAQEAAALLAKLIEPSQCEGAAAPKHGSERRPLLEAAALLNSAGRRCENCGQELECCAFWPLTAGASTADAPGGRRLLCCINCARAEGWWRVGEARSIQKREVCSFFAEGSCGEGGRCRFVHQDPNAARLAAPRAAGAPTSYPRSGESYITVLEVRVLNLGHPDLGSTLVALGGEGNRGRPRVQRLHADMAADGILRLHDELISVGGVPVEGSLGGKLILDDASQSALRAAPSRSRCTGTTTLRRQRPRRSLPTWRRSPRRPTTSGGGWGSSGWR